MHIILPLIFYAIIITQNWWFQKSKRSSVIIAKDLTNILDLKTTRYYAKRSL